jgi:hypothetical protein
LNLILNPLNWRIRLPVQGGRSWSINVLAMNRFNKQAF